MNFKEVLSYLSIVTVPAVSNPGFKLYTYRLKRLNARVFT